MNIYNIMNIFLCYYILNLNFSTGGGGFADTALRSEHIMFL